MTKEYEVPHVAHILAVLTIGLLIHPLAGMGWACVWAFHTVANIGERR